LSLLKFSNGKTAIDLFETSLGDAVALLPAVYRPAKNNPTEIIAPITTM
jgi:hypothetical protein